ncbi:MAG: cysteine desulfurase [Bacteroidales bacterium]|nr:cysteine desulfurase [Bacteroidales bacterium]MDD4528888.1 cysteine desulfurase [Bacteroidales bacterium]MDD4829325.1 cysteine desulfurase [Bacteroidales bacterium]
MRPEIIRNDFPILSEMINNKPLVYLDNAATTQKPIQVIQAMNNYYMHLNANVHRGVHTLSQNATNEFELARKLVQDFIYAKEQEEIIFTRGTTESINLVASSFCDKFLTKDDEIIISELEHHSNIVPWQLAQEKIQFKIRVIPITQSGELDIETFKTLLNNKTKLVAVAHISNALGTINPIKEIIELSHHKGAAVLIDGAQGVPHMKINVQDLDCDFYAFSGHKMYAPMGVGVLFGKRKYLDQMPPYHGGGEMIKEVSFEGTTFNEIPFKFEAGTPSVSDVIGLKSAIEYINNIGFDLIQKHEDFLMHYTTEKLMEINGLKIYGTSKNKAGSISFNINNIHPFDIGTLLDQLGIAIRTGHHCAQPVMKHYNIVGTARVSFAIYNTIEEIDFFIESVKRAKLMLS